MNKIEYIAEMLSEELEQYQIPPEIIKQCAEGLVYGLDMWYELSGDSVATSNRYAELEHQVVKATQKGEKQLAEEENRHSKELEELRRNASWSLQRKQEKIEELQKQIK